MKPRAMFAIFLAIIILSMFIFSGVLFWEAIHNPTSDPSTNISGLAAFIAGFIACLGVIHLNDEVSKL